MSSALFSVLFHGLAYSMILYLIAVGLTVTMGLMHFINIGHGAFAATGGYLTIAIMNRFGWDFPFAVVAAVLIVGLGSIPLERFLYRRFYGNDPLDQVMMSIGLIFISMTIFTYVWGSLWVPMSLPPYLRGDIHLWGETFPFYRGFIIIMGAVIAAALSLVFDRTRLGALLRATVENRRMAESVGINTSRLYTTAFVIGSGLAALGGALGADLLPIQPHYALEYCVYFLIIVVVGGLGNIRGSFIAAIILGIADTACKYWLPDLGAFAIYFATFALLLWRPAGIAGRAA